MTYFLDFLREWVGDDCFGIIIEYLCLEYGFYAPKFERSWRCFIFDPKDKTFKYKYLNAFSEKIDAYYDWPNVDCKPYIVIHRDSNYFTNSCEINYISCRCNLPQIILEYKDSKISRSNTIDNIKKNHNKKKNYHKQNHHKKKNYHKQYTKRKN